MHCFPRQNSNLLHFSNFLQRVGQRITGNSDGVFIRAFLTQWRGVSSRASLYDQPSSIAGPSAGQLLLKRRISSNESRHFSSFRASFGQIRKTWTKLGGLASHRRPFCSSTPTQQLDYRAGAEPGIDTSQSEKTSCETSEKHKSDITVVDFSNKRVQQHECTNIASLDDLLQSTPKPTWAATRWIYVNGLNYEVLRCLGMAKNLHRLAVEDVLMANSRTKVDWYDGHLCAIVTLQKLVRANAQTLRNPKSLAMPQAPLSLRVSTQQDLVGPNQQRTKYLKDRSILAMHQQLTVQIEQVSMFLTADGTVITIFESMGNEVLEPILARLQAPGTILRASNDPSMVLYAVLDAIVDLSIPISGAYDEEIRDLEYNVLTDPKITQPILLYALRSELALLLGIVKPIEGLINTLRDHQPFPHVQSTAAASSPTNPMPPMTLSADRLISPLARTYLADVHDHAIGLSTSLHAAIESVENLTSLIFNTVSAKQNESLRQLTLVTIFFLPLTFLCGYFGMNFDPFPAVNQNSDLFFWYLAGPVTLALFLFFYRGAMTRRIRKVFRWRKRAKKNSSD